jgi:transcriptional regulator with PAS, ATPase and Fis domain
MNKVSDLVCDRKLCLTLTFVPKLTLYNEDSMLTLIAKLFDRAISFPLDESQESKAGSMPENRIYLPYRGVSRHHFTIYKDDSGWILRDEGSTNGTLLNGKNVQKANLSSGDVIQIGMIRLDVFEEENQNAPILLPDVLDKKIQSRTDRVDGSSSHTREASSSAYFFPKFVFPDGFFIGNSPIIMKICERLHSLVDSDVNIMFVGETGTGKEMFARLLHLSGKRASGPFIAVNCAAIPSELIEAELFGIGERVATDVSQRRGKFLAADGGTLFLDELEAFPMHLQAKVLRAVEEKACTPVGETDPVQCDFRLLSATNEDPNELIHSNRFREDLYHRLATVEVRLPSLREDLHDLVLGMLSKITAHEGKRFAGVSQKLMGLLLNYSYPGNLRELNNILRAMVALGHNGEMLDVHLIPEKLFQQKRGDTLDDMIQENLEKNSFDFRELSAQMDRKVIQSILDHHQGNVKKAAEQMNVSEFGLRKKMSRLGISARKS